MQSGVPPEPDVDGKPDPADLAHKEAARSLELSIGTMTRAPGGADDPVTVAGREARFVTQHLPGTTWPMLYVVVDLGDGLLLTVQAAGKWERADVIKVAENVRVLPLPDLSWLGQ
jgi:hypothetical protein